MTSTYLDAIVRLEQRADYTRGFISDPFWGDDAARLGLRRMDALLEDLDRPDRRYPIIHVAGSKGKGSTSAFAASILNAANYRVGLTTSPHLHSFRERIVVGGSNVSEETFAAMVSRVDDRMTALERELPSLGRFTAFELLTAMALDHFAAAECDVAVVEVGMGGALDSTNVVTPVVSVITPLEHEHTAVLGKSLSEIAANKAGIIKAGRPVVSAAQPDDAWHVIEETAQNNDSPLWLAGRDWQAKGDWRQFGVHGRWGTFSGLRCGIAGDHQMANAALGFAAIAAAGSAFPVSAEAVKTGIAAATLPGRFEVTKVGARPLVLDGAHTPAAAGALAGTLQQVFPGPLATVIIGLADDKNIEQIAARLAPIASQVIATSAQSARATETSRIAAAFQSHSIDALQAKSVADALLLVQQDRTSENPIVVTGSFNVVAEARVALGLATPEKTPY